MLHYRLEVFRAVAELQSASKAAAVLHLSQPAVTRHIRLLEEEVRTALFHRNGKGMILTECGERYLAYVTDTIQAHTRVVQSMQSSSAPLCGRLRLGSNKTILAYHLPEVLSRFKQRHPGVVCDITDGNTDQIVDALLQGRVDVALVEGPCRRPELCAEPFLKDEIVWICASNHRLARARRVSLNDLLSTPLVVREVGGGVRQYVEAELRRQGRSLDEATILHEIPHPEAIKRAVMRGEAISFLFQIGVAAEISAGLLHAIRCPELKLSRPFSMLTPQGPVPNGIVSRFREALLEQSLRAGSTN